MPLEHFTGPDVPGLLARARARIGPDAVLVSTRRLADPAQGYEIVAADPETAAAWHAGAAARTRPVTYGPPRRFMAGAPPVPLERAALATPHAEPSAPPRPLAPPAPRPPLTP